MHHGYRKSGSGDQETEGEKAAAAAADPLGIRRGRKGAGTGEKAGAGGERIKPER